MNFPSRSSGRSLAVALAIGGLASAGLFLAAPHLPVAPMAHEAGVAAAAQPDSLAKKAGRVAGPTPAAADTGQAAATDGAAVQPPPGAVKPPPIVGLVSAVTADPPSFTVQTATGEQTLNVAETTVFSGGQDRPYSFDLLKVGDPVKVRVAPARKLGQGRAASAGRLGAGTAPSATAPATPTAARVMVLRKLKPAPGSADAGGPKGPKGAKKGGANDLLQ